MNRNNELEKTEVGMARRRSGEGERQPMPKSRTSRKFKCSVLIHPLLQVRTLGTSAMTTSYLDAYLDSRLGSTETSWPNRDASTTSYVLVYDWARVQLFGIQKIQIRKILVLLFVPKIAEI